METDHLVGVMKCQFVRFLLCPFFSPLFFPGRFFFHQTDVDQELPAEFRIFCQFGGYPIKGFKLSLNVFLSHRERLLGHCKVGTINLAIPTMQFQNYWEVVGKILACLSKFHYCFSNMQQGFGEALPANGAMSETLIEDVKDRCTKNRTISPKMKLFSVYFL